MHKRTIAQHGTLNHEKAILSLVGLLLLFSCEQRNNIDEQAVDLGKHTGKEIHFTVTEVSEEDFEVVERNDTTYYLKKLNEGLEGKDIQFNQSLISDLSAKIRFDFGFLQYTIDDNPAVPLAYTRQSEWLNLQIKEGVIEIPDFNGNSNNSKVYEKLGLKSRKELIAWIAEEDFEELRKESIQVQTDFYNALLREQEQYENCCPEYIKQANASLSSLSKNEKSVDQLELELTYKSLTIDISGHLKNGAKFRQVIVEK